MPRTINISILYLAKDGFDRKKFKMDWPMAIHQLINFYYKMRFLISVKYVHNPNQMFRRKLSMEIDRVIISSET